MTAGQVYCALLTLALAISFHQHYQFVLHSGLAKQRKRKTYLPILSPGLFRVLGWSFMGLLSACVLVADSPILLGLASLASLLYFHQVKKMSDVRRKANSVPIVLGWLALGSWAGEPGFSILMIKLLLCQNYFSAGVQKLRRSGMAWGKGDILQAYFLKSHLLLNNSLALKLSRQSLLCRVLSLCTLTFELSFGLILLSPKLSAFYLLLALCFHLGAGLVLRIHYLKFHGPALLFLWEGYGVFFESL